MTISPPETVTVAVTVAIAVAVGDADESEADEEEEPPVAAAWNCANLSPGLTAKTMPC